MLNVIYPHLFMTITFACSGELALPAVSGICLMTVVCLFTSLLWKTEDPGVAVKNTVSSAVFCSHSCGHSTLSISSEGKYLSSLQKARRFLQVWSLEGKE